MIKKKKLFHVCLIGIFGALLTFMPMRAGFAASDSFTITVRVGNVASITSPASGTTVGRTPTVIGEAEPGDNITIKGTVGGVPYQAVAQATADANGNYIVRQMKVKDIVRSH